MKCAWNELLSILPNWVVVQLQKYKEECLQEVRLREGQKPLLVFNGYEMILDQVVSQSDLQFCINTATRYSPWAAQTVSKGFITAPGGHRIGICGETAVHNGCVLSMRTPSSLCVRVARDFPGCGRQAQGLGGSILVIGPPGSGKTTLERDIIRQISYTDNVSVIDERMELFPKGFDRGKQVDVLFGCPKADGIEMVLRCMSPTCIAVDEVTAAEDCKALSYAGWCGVRLIATAHAASIEDLKNRAIYKPLIENCLFDHIIVLQRDKSWREERMIP